MWLIIFIYFLICGGYSFKHLLCSGWVQFPNKWPLVEGHALLIRHVLPESEPSRRPLAKFPFSSWKRKWNCNYIYGSLSLSRSLSRRKSCKRVGLLLGSLAGDCIKMSPLSRSHLCLSAVAWPQDPVAGEEISLLLHRCANLMTFGNLPNSNLLLVPPCPVLPCHRANRCSFRLSQLSSWAAICRRGVAINLLKCRKINTTGYSCTWPYLSAKCNK